MPVAAMQSLSELIAQTESKLKFICFRYIDLIINTTIVATMFELMEAVKDAATNLKRHYSHNSVSLSAGCDVFYQFISSLRDFGQVYMCFMWRKYLFNLLFRILRHSRVIL